jgi:hypothetical protein
MSARNTNTPEDTMNRIAKVTVTIDTRTGDLAHALPWDAAQLINSNTTGLAVRNTGATWEITGYTETVKAAWEIIDAICTLFDSYEDALYRTAELADASIDELVQSTVTTH